MKSRHNPIIVLIFLFCLYPLTLQAADPPAPQNLQASDGTYATKVLITWQESTGAVSYRVWVADNSEFIAAGLLGETSDTWMEHSFGTPGETYWYRSKARNSEYEWSGFSDPDSGWRETPATAPENVTASDGTYSDKVVVEWDAAESGNEYMVYRAVGDSPNKSQVTGWQNETSYEDTDVTPDTLLPLLGTHTPPGQCQPIQRGGFGLCTHPGDPVGSGSAWYYHPRGPRCSIERRHSGGC